MYHFTNFYFYCYYSEDMNAAWYLRTSIMLRARVSRDILIMAAQYLENYFDLVRKGITRAKNSRRANENVYVSIWNPTLACANANFWHYGHETWLRHAWFGQIRMQNSPCCRQGHADLTRTVSGASDAEPDGIKHIEPIDRIPARESKEQCEKLQVAPRTLSSY